MSGRSYPLRIPENLIELAEARARDEKTDRATALRQLIYVGAEEYVIRLLSQGRISVSKAAELLDSSVRRIHFLAREHGIDIDPTPEEHEQATRTARQLL